MEKHQLIIYSTLKALEGFHCWIEEKLKTMNLEGFSKNNIVLVSFEMATNAVLHGNKEESHKRVTIILVQTKEESKELDYLSENGRGLKLAVLLSDTIEYENNCMKIVFKKNNNL